MVITRSCVATTGFTMSICKRLPGAQGAPRHSMRRYASEKRRQRLQSEKILHANPHSALVVRLYSTRTISGFGRVVHTGGVRPGTGLSG
jgi:hypothetical protein